jgi:hypothetical protein
VGRFRTARPIPEPERVREGATIRFVGWGLPPAGALPGGLLAERLGVLSALTVATVLSLAACLWPLLLMPRAVEPMEPASEAAGGPTPGLA